MSQSMQSAGNDPGWGVSVESHVLQCHENRARTMFTETEKEILLLCYYDYTGLWLILKTICKNDYSVNKIPHWARKRTIEIISNLLEEELLEAGFVAQNSHKFVSFNWSPSETIDIIEKQWDQLGRIPNIGDICDFFVTFKGKKLVKDLGWDIV